MSCSRIVRSANPWLFPAPALLKTRNRLLQSTRPVPKFELRASMIFAFQLSIYQNYFRVRSMCSPALQNSSLSKAMFFFPESIIQQRHELCGIESIQPSDKCLLLLGSCQSRVWLDTCLLSVLWFDHAKITARSCAVEMAPTCSGVYKKTHALPFNPPNIIAVIFISKDKYSHVHAWAKGCGE